MSCFSWRAQWPQITQVRTIGWRLTTDRYQCSTSTTVSLPIHSLIKRHAVTVRCTGQLQQAFVTIVMSCCGSRCTPLLYYPDLPVYSPGWRGCVLFGVRAVWFIVLWLSCAFVDLIGLRLAPYRSLPRLVFFCASIPCWIIFYYVDRALFASSAVWALVVQLLAHVVDTLRAHSNAKQDKHKDDTRGGHRDGRRRAGRQ